MSKIYLKYLKLKESNNLKYYLFKSGNFYIFIDEDAKKISSITTLCLTNLNNDIVKCGFPVNSINKYISIFNNLNIDIEIIYNIEENSNNNINIIIKKLKKIDIENITPIKSLNILKELKDLINE